MTVAIAIEKMKSVARALSHKGHKRAAVALALLLSVLLAADVDSRNSNPHPPERKIKVAVRPISFDRGDPKKSSFGRLSWRGGVQLTSPAREFGGYSGIAVTADGDSFYAVSDDGTWLSGDFVYSGRMLTGVKKTEIGPLLSRKGKRLWSKRDADAEDIVLTRDGGNLYALISFERRHRIARFPIEGRKILPPISSLNVPKKALNKGDDNQGLESLTVLTDSVNKGKVLTFAERLLDDDGNHTGWLLHDDEVEQLGMKRHPDFDVTSMATLPNGNVLVLERSFSLFSGVAMRLSEIDHADIRPGALLKPRKILLAYMGYEIDNMEAMAVHVNRQGETIVTLLSDDNFNRNGLQRTLLMQFKLD